MPAVALAELGIKDDCLDLHSKGGKIGTLMENLRLECCPPEALSEEERQSQGESAALEEKIPMIM